MLDEGPWIIGGQILLLQAWCLDFNPAYQVFAKMPLWVRFPQLEIGLWNRRNLITVAKVVGTPVRFDPSTLLRSKFIFTRMKILVDLSKPLPKA